MSPKDWMFTKEEIGPRTEPWGTLTLWVEMKRRNPKGTKKELLENRRKTRSMWRQWKPESQVKITFPRSKEGLAMTHKSRWGLKIGFNNMEINDDFDKTVSINSRKSHIGIHFRRNEKRGLEIMNMLISFEKFCCIREKRISNWRKCFFFFFLFLFLF